MKFEKLRSIAGAIVLCAFVNAAHSAALSPSQLEGAADYDGGATIVEHALVLNGFNSDAVTGGKDGEEINGTNATYLDTPAPAAVWLFGTAIIGFFGYSRRKALFGTEKDKPGA